MLYLFLCVIFILGTAAQTPVELKCDLPPPEVPNGVVELMTYELAPRKIVFRKDFNASITKVYAYDVRVICNPGANRFGSRFLFNCYEGRFSEMPECVMPPVCEKNLEDQSLISCGIGRSDIESKCMIPREGIAGFAGTLTGPDPKCGRLGSGSLVVNGAPAKYGTVPWHVGIYTKTTMPYMQVCGGTLVRDNVVISAAHCFWSDIEKKLPAENYAVAAGKIYRPWNNVNDTDTATKSDVREIRIPPRYRGGATNFQDDLAVLLLTTPLKVDNFVVVLACLNFDNTLDEKQLQDGSIGTVAGWGLTSADGPASQILNVVKLPIVDIDRCINGADPSFLSSITSDKICAGYTNGTTVCRGDSGGGLTIPETDFEGDKYYLRGIVSTAPKSDHLCNVYAVATFTHVARHRHFINAAISETPERPSSISIGINEQQATIQLTDPLNADVNTDVEQTLPMNGDGNGFNILPITNSPNDDPEETTTKRVGLNQQSATVPLNSDLNTDELTLPLNRDDDVSNILPITNSPEETTIGKIENNFCKLLTDILVKRCYANLSDLYQNINFNDIKCKKANGNRLSECDDD